MSGPRFKFEKLGENVNEEIEKNSYFLKEGNFDDLLNNLNMISSEHQPTVFNYYMRRSMDGREPTKNQMYFFVSCINSRGIKEYGKIMDVSSTFKKTKKSVQKNKRNKRSISTKKVLKSRKSIENRKRGV
jgi:hypothetical protein